MYDLQQLSITCDRNMQIAIDVSRVNDIDKGSSSSSALQQTRIAMCVRVLLLLWLLFCCSGCSSSEMTCLTCPCCCLCLQLFSLPLSLSWRLSVAVAVAVVVCQVLTSIEVGCNNNNNNKRCQFYKNIMWIAMRDWPLRLRRSRAKGKKSQEVEEKGSVKCCQPGDLCVP